jgi:integrase/recombinase XerD
MEVTMSRRKGQSGRAAVLAPEELKLVFDSVEARPNAARNKALLGLSFYLGLRAKEIASLLHQDVYDPGGGLRDVIHIKRAYSKMGKLRDVYVSAHGLREILVAYRESRGTCAGSDPLFATRTGRAFTPNGLAHHFKDMYLFASFDRASSHSGRRTMITRLAEQGTDLKALACLAGHSNIATTSIYIENNPVRLARIMATVDLFMP